MKQKQKTEWEKHQEMRLQRDMPDVKWIARVGNFEENETEGWTVETEFTSDNSDLDCIAHKVKLDLITNLLHGFENPILVRIKKK